MQVADLRLRCMQQLLANMSLDNVLEYAKTADMLDDDILMDACLSFWTNPEHRLACHALACSLLHQAWANIYIYIYIYNTDH